jgi:hypothetical protein
MLGLLLLAAACAESACASSARAFQGPKAILLPQVKNERWSTPGYVQPDIVGVAFPARDTLLDLLRPRLQGDPSPVDVDGGELVRVFIAHVDPANPTAALAGVEMMGVDLSSYPVGHPSRPRVCDEEGATIAARSTLSATRDLAAPLACLEFIAPDGDGDGYQVELAEAQSGVLAREGGLLCYIVPVSCRVVCDGIARPSAVGGGRLSTLHVVPDDLPPSRFVSLSPFVALSINRFGGGLSCWSASELANACSAIPPDLPPSRFIATYAAIACSISAVDGTLRCWNAGSTGDEFVPILREIPRDLPPVLHVAITDRMACAITLNGTLVCWGDVADYAKFDLDLEPVASLAASEFNFCAVTASRRLVCVSANQCEPDPDFHAQFGEGRDGSVGCGLVPLALAHTLISTVSVSQESVCVTDTGGMAHCWMIPAALSGVRSARSINRENDCFPLLRAIEADMYAPCGLRGDTGQVICWGEPSMSPLTSASFASRTPAVVALSIADFVVCGTALFTGRVVCRETGPSVWIGHSSLIVTQPRPYSLPVATQLFTPAQVVDNEVFEPLAALTGLDRSGRLTQLMGRQQWNWTSSVLPLNIPSSVVTISGSQSSICGILRGSRKVVCTPDTLRSVDYVFAEDGPPTPHPRVARVPADLPPAAAIAVAEYHACIIVVGTGAVRCWGVDVDRSPEVFAPPADLPPAAAITAGESVMCVILSGSGLVRCWGSADFGQLDVPADLGSVLSIGAGDGFACALTDAADRRTVRCWGRSRRGCMWSTFDAPFLGPVISLHVGPRFVCVDYAGVRAADGLERPITGAGMGCSRCHGNTTAPTIVANDGLSGRNWPEADFGAHTADFHGWQLTACFAHPQSSLRSALPVCDTAEVPFRFTPGQLRSAAFVVGTALTPATLVMTVDRLGARPPVASTSPTFYDVQVCVADCLRLPLSELVVFPCSTASRISATLVQCAIPPEARFGGNVTVRLTGAGVDLGYVITTVDPDLSPSLSSWSFNSRGDAHASVSLADTAGEVLPMLLPGDPVVLRGARLWNIVTLTVKEDNSTIRTVVTSSPVIQFCVSFPAAAWSVNVLTVGCECSGGAEMFPGQGEVPLDDVEAWTDTEIRVLLPLGAGLRVVAVCAAGHLSLRNDWRFVLGMPRVESATLLGTMRTNERISVAIAGTTTRLLSLPGAALLYEVLTNPIRFSTTLQPVVLPRAYPDAISLAAVAVGLGWPTARMVLTIGRKCFSTVGEHESLQPPARGLDGDLCEEWSQWRVTTGSGDPIELTSNFAIPVGLLRADVSVAVLDASGLWITVDARSGVRPLPVAQPQYVSAVLVGGGLIQGPQQRLAIAGTAIRSVMDLEQAEAGGWCFPGEAGLGMSIRLISNTSDAIFCNQTEADATASSEFLTLCTLPRDTPAGWFRLDVQLLAQTVDTTGMAEIELGCLAGHFGRRGETCLPCVGFFPTGAVTCPGGTSLPQAQVAWHNLGLSGPASARTCPAGAAHLSGRSLCLVSCEPPESCLGGNVCGTGYEDSPPGWRCSTCATSFYRTAAGSCVACPEARASFALIALTLVVLCAAALYVLSASKVQLPLVIMLADFCQMVSLVAPTGGVAGTHLPAALAPVIYITSAISLNINLLAVDCFVSNLPTAFELQFYSVVCLPPFIAVLSATPFCVRWAWERATGRSGGGPGSQSSRSEGGPFHKYDAYFHAGLRAALVALQFVYFIIVSTVLSVWNCIPSNPPAADGRLFLAALPYEPCFTDDAHSLQAGLLHLAIPALIFYVLGMPLAVAYFFSRYHTRLSEDQRLQEATVPGGTELLSKEARFMRKTWGPLYEDYRPGYHFFYLVNLGRKALVCILRLVLNRAPALQLLGALLPLQVGFLVSALARPLFSPSMHIALRAARRASGAEAAALEQAAVILDLNTVQSSLLAAASVLVTLGAMWQHLAPGSSAAAYYPDAVAGITVAAYVLIAGVLWGVAMVLRADLSLDKPVAGGKSTAEKLAEWASLPRHMARMPKAESGAGVEQTGGPHVVLHDSPLSAISGEHGRGGGSRSERVRLASIPAPAAERGRGEGGAGGEPGSGPLSVPQDQ